MESLPELPTHKRVQRAQELSYDLCGKHPFGSEVDFNRQRLAGYLHSDAKNAEEAQAHLNTLPKRIGARIQFRIGEMREASDQ